MYIFYIEFSIDVRENENLKRTFSKLFALRFCYTYVCCAVFVVIVVIVFIESIASVWDASGDIVSLMLIVHSDYLQQQHQQPLKQQSHKQPTRKQQQQQRQQSCQIVTIVKILLTTAIATTTCKSVKHTRQAAKQNQDHESPGGSSVHLVWSDANNNNIISSSSNSNINNNSNGNHNMQQNFNINTTKTG